MKIVEAGLAPVREIENLWIPMADGVRLAARVWRPVDAERTPVPALVSCAPTSRAAAGAVQGRS